MIVYLFLYIVCILIFYTTLESKKKIQIRAMSIFLLFIGFFVGLGDMLGGYDRYIYAALFEDLSDVIHAGGNPWTTDSFLFYASEFGYGTFSVIMGYITGNRYIFIFTITIIIYALLIKSLKQYVENAPFAVVMFMGLWFFFTFTYLRQVLACTIIWLSVRYIIERDLRRFLVIWFIAYSFHNSALIFLPLYFIPQKMISPKIVIYIMIGALLMGLSPIPSFIFETYGEVEETRANVAGYAVETGFRWAYLIEAVFFLFLILKNYREIQNKKEIVMLNISLVFCVVLLLFVRSENGGRLGWYFMIGLLCTLSNLCVHGRRLQSQGIMMLLVCFFLYVRILYSWAFNLCPYKTFLTNGHTAEVVHEHFEYDFNYDRDKFYRPALWILE